MRTVVRYPITALQLALGSSALTACLAVPPQSAVDTGTAVVRAPTTQEAEVISELVDHLQPEVIALLPDTHAEAMEIWLQDRPSLYRYPRAATGDAEGLWSEAHGRILLSRNADSLERTLAHELVHASLGVSWRRLPGSLEEGLCDLVSSVLSPDGAARLRAGRLSSAALACGGLPMELAIEHRQFRASGPSADDESKGSWTARIVLTGEAQPNDAHLDVFRVQAGLSSSSLASVTKRGFYGLSFLVVDRVVTRIGFDGLNELCVAAGEKELSHIPRRWLLEAAGLGESLASWRNAANEAFGDEELVELLRMYSDFVVDALVEYLDSLDPALSVDERLSTVDARLTLIDGGASVDLMGLDFITDAVRARF